MASTEHYSTDIYKCNGRLYMFHVITKVLRCIYINTNKYDVALRNCTLMTDSSRSIVIYRNHAFHIVKLTFLQWTRVDWIIIAVSWQLLICVSPARVRGHPPVSRYVSSNLQHTRCVRSVFTHITETHCFVISSCQRT